MTKTRTPDEKIDLAFRKYLATADLLDSWHAQKSNMDEFLILACARLDSLSNLAFPHDPQKKGFLRFLSAYSPRRKLFDEVSVPDLFAFLSYHLELLPATIKKAGRLDLFDARRDSGFFSFLWNTNFALVEDDIARLLKFLRRALKANYRVVPNQKKSKPSSDTKAAIVEVIRREASGPRMRVYRDSAGVIEPLLDEFTAGVRLYQEYRCASIHGYGVDIMDDLFFGSARPYWGTFYRSMVPPGRLLTQTFPAGFLAALLRACTEQYKRHLKKTHKLPADIFFEFFDIYDEMKFLDADSIPNSKDINLRLGR